MKRTQAVHTLGLEELSQAVRYRRDLFELIEPHLGDSVLEVGAGIGDFAAQLTGRRRMIVTDIQCWWGSDCLVWAGFIEVLRIGSFGPAV
jgi:hypothetical protein